MNKDQGTDKNEMDDYLKSKSHTKVTSGGSVSGV